MKHRFRRMYRELVWLLYVFLCLGFGAWSMNAYPPLNGNDSFVFLVVLLSLLVAVIALVVLPARIPRWKALLVTGVSLTYLSPSVFLALMVLPSVFLGVGVGYSANAWLDFSQPTYHDVVVVDRSNQGSSCVLYIDSWEQRSERIPIEVNHKDYADCHIGTRLTVVTREGAFGCQWIKHVHCAPIPPQKSIQEE